MELVFWLLTFKFCLMGRPRAGASYGNNTRMICCLVQRRPESAAGGMSLPDDKSQRCFCNNSLPTVINPVYTMTKQLCIKRIYDKNVQIATKSSDVAYLPPLLHHNLSSTTGVVGLHISSWRVGVREERRQALKTVWLVNARIIIYRYENNSYGISNHNDYIRHCFRGISQRFTHNNNETYRQWHQDGGWHGLSIMTNVTVGRRKL